MLSATWGRTPASAGSSSRLQATIWKLPIVHLPVHQPHASRVSACDCGGFPACAHGFQPAPGGPFPTACVLLLCTSVLEMETALQGLLNQPLHLLYPTPCDLSLYIYPPIYLSLYLSTHLSPLALLLVLFFDWTLTGI